MLKVAAKFAPQQPAFETAYRAGFRNAEFWLNEDLLANWRQIAAVARHYPLNYVLHFPNRKELSRETLESVVHLYRALECRAMAIHQPQFDRYASTLRSLDPTIELAIENHRLTSEQFQQWARESPGLTLDIEHLWKFTLQDAPLERLVEEMRSFLAQYGEKLRHVHLPGYLPGYGEHHPMYCSREMIFEMFSLLSEAKYDGLIVSETRPENQNVNEMRMDVLLFDTWRSLHDPLSSTPS